MAAKVIEQSDPFLVRCTRCRGFQTPATDTELSQMLFLYQSLGKLVLCPPCSEIILELRRPFFDAAYDAAVEEINAYHAANPVDKGTVLSVVEKGDLH